MPSGTTGRAGFTGVGPLDWFQLRTLLWEVIENLKQDSVEQWANVAEYINTRCTHSQLQPPKVYRSAVAHLAPEILAPTGGVKKQGLGYDLWTRLLYSSVHGFFNPPPRLMNLGYAELDADDEVIFVEGMDDLTRLGLQLYVNSLRGVNLEGCDVLDIGCGTGGGCAYISADWPVRSIQGVDLVEENITAARHIHADTGVAFRIADALALPFPDAAFDIVINIESSHCYRSVELFLEEVQRVLRPSGYFVLADHRPLTDEWGPGRTAQDLKRQLRRSGLTLVEHRDITANVVKSMVLTSEIKHLSIEYSNMSDLDRIHFEEIMHCEGSNNFQKLASGEWRYSRYLLQKRTSRTTTTDHV